MTDPLDISHPHDPEESMPENELPVENTEGNLDPLDAWDVVKPDPPSEPSDEIDPDAQDPYADGV